MIECNDCALIIDRAWTVQNKKELSIFLKTPLIITLLGDFKQVSEEF